MSLKLAAFSSDPFDPLSVISMEYSTISHVSA